MEHVRHLAASEAAPRAVIAQVLPIESLRSVAAARRPPPVVEMDRVSKVFESAGKAARPAVADVSLALSPGSATLICGPSGSGKTTLLSLIGCMTRPTSGRIRVDGRDVSRLPEDRLAELRRRRFGFVFQGNHLIQGATALDNVMLPALPCPECRPGLRQRALEILRELGLGDHAQRRVEWLSGGEQQRVAIARALINDPQVVLADEPTAHLDRETGGRFLDLVDRFLMNGLTLVVASHDPLVVGCGRFTEVVELRNGRAA